MSMPVSSSRLDVVERRPWEWCKAKIPERDAVLGGEEAGVL
jgi:hypothetical protein